MTLIAMALVTVGVSVFLLVSVLSLLRLLPLSAPVVDDVARVPTLVPTPARPTGLGATARGVADSPSPSVRRRILFLLLDYSRRYQRLDPSRYRGCGIVFTKHGDECLHERCSNREVLLRCIEDALAF